MSSIGASLGPLTRPSCHSISGRRVRFKLAWASLGTWASRLSSREASGVVVRALPDPSGGTFDAAGDFDRFLDDRTTYPALGSIDPYADVILDRSLLPQLLADVDAATSEAVEGREARGLRRLRVLAERCLADDALTLVVIGD